MTTWAVMTNAGRVYCVETNKSDADAAANLANGYNPYGSPHHVIPYIETKRKENEYA